MVFILGKVHADLFFDKFCPKIKVLEVSTFQHFIESYQKAKWLWFRYKIWAKLVPML